MGEWRRVIARKLHLKQDLEGQRHKDGKETRECVAGTGHTMPETQVGECHIGLRDPHKAGVSEAGGVAES